MHPAAPFQVFFKLPLGWGGALNEEEIEQLKILFTEIVKYYILLYIYRDIDVNVSVVLVVLPNRT